MKSSILFPLLLCAVAGCRTYTPAPVDWEQERAAWTAQSAEPRDMTLAEAKQYALFLNPEINALRVRHLASSNAVRQTGWWDDPELDVDALRFIKGVPHPWILGSSLAFTIPVNGVPALERKAAEAYTFADACAIIVAERALMADVERAWVQFEYTQKRFLFLLQHVFAFQREAVVAQALFFASELDATEWKRIELENKRLETELLNAKGRVEAQSRALLQLLGFHPSASVWFDVDASGDAQAPAVTPTEDALVRHPRVQEKLARLGATEADLRTEIRRQYPNIRIGPALQSEEGLTRAGLTFGLTLPLWNRNRKAIAEAEGARQSARIEALNEWKRLVSELETAQEMLRLSETNERLRREMELPAALRSLDAIKSLYEVGEADVVALLAALQTYAAVWMDWLDAKQAVREAQISVRYFAE